MSFEAVDNEASPPLVSVILPVLNGAGRLEHALDALHQQDFGRERFEIIVADGRSRDATVEIATARGCRVVDNPGITVAAGRNAGVRHARGELIAFSEDDIVLPPHWLSSAVRLLTETGAAGVGGPTPIPPSSSLWSHAVNAVFRLASAQGASVQSDRVPTGLVNDLPGGNSLYTARALRAVGPIDETLTTAEDVAMHHEFRRLGLELRLSQQLAAEHHKRDSVLGFLGQMQRFAIGRVQLFRRWPGALSPMHWAAAIVGPVAAIALCCVMLAADGLLLGAFASLAWISAMVLARRQGERFSVAAVFPVAFGVFLAGWSLGFWSELVVASRSATRVRFFEKVADILAEAPREGRLWIRRLLSGLIALKCALLGLFSQRAPLVMDEFQQGGYARHIDAGYYSALVPFKTVLFTYPYYLPRLWLERASDILLVQRAETVVVVLSTLSLLYAISRRLGRTKLEALLVVAAALCFSTFFEQSVRLRAEPFALLMAMLALHAAVSAGSQRAPSWLDPACGVCLAAAFFCTQKAIWFGVSIGSSVCAATWVASRSPRVVLLRALALSAGFAGVTLAYGFAFHPATPAQVFRGVFLRSSRFALEGNHVYHDLGRYIRQSLDLNTGLYALCAVGLVLGVARYRRDPALLLCGLTTLFMSLFILTWKEPWPYTLTWWIPFLVLFVPEAVRVGRAAPFPASPRARAVVLTFASVTLVGIGVPRNIEALAWDNRGQLALVDHVERLLAPGDRYQDGIGMISTRELSGLVWWDARALDRISRAHDRGDSSELEAAFCDPPKVLIANYRLRKIRKALAPFLDKSYIPVDRGLLLAGIRLGDSATTPFEARWAGRYALVDGNGRWSERPWFVDGAEQRGGAPIARGSHAVEAPDCAGCSLIPEDVVGQVLPAAKWGAARVFPQPYAH